MYSYSILGQQLIDNGIISKENLFDYSFSPYKEFYEQFYQFCQTNLTEEWKGKNIQPALFYFHNHNSFNAFALKCKNYNVIGINYIFPYSLVSDFNDFDKKITEYFPQEQIERIFKEENFSPSYLITQFSLLFIYYHELGHILQNIPNSSLINEKCENEEYDKLRHIREFDADIFSAEKLAMHINEYWLKHCSVEQFEDLEILLAIGISGVFDFIVHTFNLTTSFYTAKSTHPHPTIRVSYIIEFIMMAIVKIHSDKKINSNEIVKTAFHIAQFQVTSNELIATFISMFKENYEETKSYTNELFEEVKQSQNLSMSEKIN